MVKSHESGSPPSPKRTISRGSPSDRTVKLLVRLSPGDLTRTATAFAGQERDSAEFFSAKLQEALSGNTKK